MDLVDTDEAKLPLTCSSPIILSDVGSSSDCSDSDMTVDPMEISSDIDNMPSTSCPFPNNSRPLVQSKLPFKPIPREEWRTQEKERYHDRQALRQDLLERLKVKKALKEIKRREYERVRKRAQRARRTKVRAIMMLAAKEVKKEQVSVSVSSIVLHIHPHISRVCHYSTLRHLLLLILILVKSSQQFPANAPTSSRLVVTPLVRATTTWSQAKSSLRPTGHSGSIGATH